MRLALVALAIVIAGCANTAARWPGDAGTTVFKESAHSVDGTTDRIRAAAPSHGAAVEGPTPTVAGGDASDQSLIVSLPQYEAAIVASGPRAGIELPVRMRVWEEDGAVFLSYPAPSGIARRAGLEPDAPQVNGLAAALDALSDAATAP